MWYVAVVCCVVYVASLLYRLLDIDAILQRQDTLGDVPLRSPPLLSPSSLAFHSARTRQDRLKQRTLWSAARRSSLMPAHKCPRRAHAALQRLAIVPPQPLEPAMPSSCAKCNMQPTDLSDETTLTSRQRAPALFHRAARLIAVPDA